MVVEDQPDLLVVDSGLPSDTFNKVARARFADSAADRRIENVIRHFRAVKRPFAWWVGPGSRPLDLEVRLVAHGLEAAESELGMSMELAELGPMPAAPRELEIQRAASPREIADLAAVFAANWDPPDEAALTFYQSATAVLLEASCPMILFVGYLGGAPVSCSELFMDRVPGGFAGVYSVATRREYRNRGIGSAVTWAALNEVRRQGFSTAVLQSSEAGRGAYTRLGFTPCCHFTEYTLPIPAAPSGQNRP